MVLLRNILLTKSLHITLQINELWGSIPLVKFPSEEKWPQNKWKQNDKKLQETYCIIAHQPKG